VRLAASEVSLHWDHTKGSLLDAAEAAGALLAANCRAGVCGACRQQVASGTVFHLAEAPFPLGPHEVLTCCAVPTSDVTLLA
jgi:ferredoxin